jgi:hypothetical protein
MAQFVQVTTSGDEMLVQVSRRDRFQVAGFFLFCGVLVVGYGVRKLTGTAQSLTLLGAAACILLSVCFGLFHRRVVIDKRKKVVSAQWRLGSLSGGAEREVGEENFRVERSREKIDQDTTYYFTAYFADLPLFRISEYHGGQNEAERVAKEMAHHVDRMFTGTRDSELMTQALEREGNHALYPLYALGLMLAVGAIYVAFFL